MSHDPDNTDEPPDCEQPLYDPKAWCTEETTARHPGESHGDWLERMLVAADEHGDHDFVKRFEQAVAARMLGSGQPIPEA